MKLYIKNMVCDRCCLVIDKLLKDMDLTFDSVTLGEIDFGKGRGSQLSDNQKQILSNMLDDLGFSILSDKKNKLIADIKISCLSHLNSIENPDKKRLSDHICADINLEYNYLSNLFSAVESMTIEQYFIRLRVERVKELLVYGEESLAEIAFRVGYSSVAHLSAQFKKITGLTPSYFRSLKDQKLRQPLDKL